MLPCLAPSGQAAALVPTASMPESGLGPLMAFPRLLLWERGAVRIGCGAMFSQRACILLIPNSGGCFVSDFETSGYSKTRFTLNCMYICSNSIVNKEKKVDFKRFI